MKRRLVSLTDVVQPFSTETRADYVKRFSANQDMRSLLGDSVQRASVANEAFRARWKEAAVTVRRADGVEFFID